MKVKKIVIFFSLLLMSIIFLIVFLSGKKYPVTGDGKEYILMSQGYINHLSPDLWNADISDVNSLFEKNAPNLKGYFFDCQENIDCTKEAMLTSGYFRSFNGGIYSWHFSAYSLLNAPVYYLFSWLGYWPTSSFVATNFILLFIASFFVIFVLKETFFYRMLILLSLLTSTTYSYVLWNHPEIFTLSLCTISLILLKNNSFKLASIAMALAALQNQPLGLVAGLIFIYGFVSTVGISKNNITIFLRNTKVAALTIFSGFISILIILYPSIFYYSKFGVPNLIIAHDASDSSLISIHRLYDLFFDLNQGMILLIPLQILCTIIILPLSVFFRFDNKRLKFAFFCLFLSIIAAIPCLSTKNWNPGGQDVLRYSYWLAIPVIFSFAEACSILKINKLISTLVFVIYCGFIAYLSINGSLFARNNIEYTKLAKFTMGHSPWLYNPDPEIFIERAFNKEGMNQPFFERGYSIAYIKNGLIRKQIGLKNKLPLTIDGCEKSSAERGEYLYYNYSDECVLIKQGPSGIIVLPSSSIKKGGVIDFNETIFNATSGWSDPESAFRWSIGSNSFVLFNIDSADDLAKINAVTISGTTYGNIITIIKLNGHTIFDGSLTMNSNDKKIVIPDNVLQRGVNALTFEWENPVQPGNGDNRYISFALSHISF